MRCNFFLSVYQSEWNNDKECCVYVQLLWKFDKKSEEDEKQKLSGKKKKRRRKRKEKERGRKKRWGKLRKFNFLKPAKKLEETEQKQLKK